MSSDLTAQDQPPLTPPPPPPPPPDVRQSTSSIPSATAVPPAPPSSKAEATPPPSDPKKPPAPEPDNIVTIPSYSRWFTWDGIHGCEVRQLPEFFDGKSPSKNPRVYKYYRNSIIKKYRANPSRKITFTEVRRTLVGDVGSIRRVFDFLDTWGLINYTPSGKQPVRWDERESKSSLAATPPPAAAAAGDAASAESNGERSKKWCSGCKAVCTIACFVCDKYDLVLCARCYVRGNYRVGVSSTEFRRVEISEQVKTDWTDKETLLLLEAVMHYGDDWKRVAEHVGGRTEKECVARFIKLPFGEQFVEPVDHGDEGTASYQIKGQTNGDSGIEPPAKRQHLTPLADASNPIMAQAAFLSALAGVEVSEAAAQAAISALYDIDGEAQRGKFQSQAHPLKQQEPGAVTNGDSALRARADAESLLEQEEDEFVTSISTIIEVEMKKIWDKLARYEQMELQLEKERHQLQQMQHQLFLDQLTILLHKIAASKSAETTAQENVRKELTPSS
uniref:SWI/SNF complex subunit SWI3B n=1 Tax=Opuntia streptacantha TaxID=393608 RepID=A0A7C8ZVX8_OPUST